jgi:hypothetical protein
VGSRMELLHVTLLEPEIWKWHPDKTIFSSDVLLCEKKSQVLYPFASCAP